MLNSFITHALPPTFTDAAPFDAQHPCDSGSASQTQAAYDIVRSRSNGSRQEAISPTSFSLQCLSTSLPGAFDNLAKLVLSQLDPTTVRPSLTYKMSST